MSNLDPVLVLHFSIDEGKGERMIIGEPLRFRIQRDMPLKIATLWMRHRLPTEVARFVEPVLKDMGFRNE